jgi:hypothetical protein
MWLKLLALSALTGAVLWILAVSPRKLLPCVLLVVTLRAIRRNWKKLRWLEEEPAVDPADRRAVTRMVIQLRKQKVLDKLQMPSSEVIFVSHGDDMPANARRAPGRQ